MDIKVITPEDFNEEQFTIDDPSNKISLKPHQASSLTITNTYVKIWEGRERDVSTEIDLSESLIDKEFFIVVTQDSTIDSEHFGRASNLQVGLNGEASPYTVYINKFATNEATFEYRLLQNGTKFKIIWNPNHLDLLEIWVKRQIIQQNT